MRKFLFILLLLVCCCVKAQDMRLLFVEAPDSIFPLQTKRVRTEMVEFVAAGMRYELSNLLDGKSVLEQMDDDYMLLRSTASSTIQMKKLPYGESYVVCVVNTISAEVADSRVAFFDSEWNRLSAGSFFEFPAIRDFFSGDTAVGADVLNICNIYLVALSLNANDCSMVAEYTMPGYMSKEDAELVAPLLRKLVYKWNGDRFVIE